MTLNKKSLLIVAIGLYVASAGVYGIWAHRKVNQWSQTRAKEIAASPKVNITPEGTKYHRWGHYRDRSKEVSLYEAKEQGFEHCKICFPASYDRNVFITPPPPWPVAHWLAVIIALTVAVSAAGFFGSQIAYPTRVVLLSAITTVPAFLLLLGLLGFLMLLINKLPRYAAGLILGAAAISYAVFSLWKRGFRLRG